MDSHRELKLHIPAYVASTLDEGTRALVESHLESCRECHELVCFCEELAARVGDPDEVQELHPSPSALHDHATGSGGRGVAHHVAGCAACSLVVSDWKSRQPTPPPVRLQAPRWVGLAWRPLAAGALAGAAVTLIGVLAWWGGTQRAVPARWTGHIEVLQLRAPQRGDEGEPVQIRLARAQPFLPIAVYLVLPRESKDDDVVLFALRAADGSTSWQQALPVATVRARLEASWNLFFLVPAGDYPPGRYRLEVVLQSAGSDLLLLERAFEVSRP